MGLIVRHVNADYSFFIIPVTFLSACRLRKKSCQGSARFVRAAKFPILKSEGLSIGCDHWSGLDMGALGRRLTEKGATIVCTKPLRKGSR